jgi:hypothetical protein
MKQGTRFRLACDGVGVVKYRRLWIVVTGKARGPLKQRRSIIEAVEKTVVEIIASAFRAAFHDY